MHGVRLSREDRIRSGNDNYSRLLGPSALLAPLQKPVTSTEILGSPLTRRCRVSRRKHLGGQTSTWDISKLWLSRFLLWGFTSKFLLVGSSWKDLILCPYLRESELEDEHRPLKPSCCRREPLNNYIFKHHASECIMPEKS